MASPFFQRQRKRSARWSTTRQLGRTEEPYSRHTAPCKSCNLSVVKNLISKRIYPGRRLTIRGDLPIEMYITNSVQSPNVESDEPNCPLICNANALITISRNRHVYRGRHARSDHSTTASTVYDSPRETFKAVRISCHCVRDTM
jgi:hypothetical protein